MGVTHRIEKAVEALNKGQIEKALLLLDKEETRREFRDVQAAAQTCLGDREKCQGAMTEAAGTLTARITPAIDTTSLEGVAQYLGPRPEPQVQEAPSAEVEAQPPAAEDDECEECRVADAVDAFAEICREGCADCGPLQTLVGHEDTPPEEWIRAMKEVKDSSCAANAQELGEVYDWLKGYLEERQSPYAAAFQEEPSSHNMPALESTTAPGEDISPAPPPSE